MKLNSLVAHGDCTYQSVALEFWNSTELTVSIICVCVPAIRTLYRYWRRGRVASKNPSGGTPRTPKSKGSEPVKSSDRSAPLTTQTMGSLTGLGLGIGVGVGVGVGLGSRVHETIVTGQSDSNGGEKRGSDGSTGKQSTGKQSTGSAGRGSAEGRWWWSREGTQTHDEGEEEDTESHWTDGGIGVTTTVDVKFADGERFRVGVCCGDCLSVGWIVTEVAMEYCGSCDLILSFVVMWFQLRGVDGMMDVEKADDDGCGGKTSDVVLFRRQTSKGLGVIHQAHLLPSPTIEFHQYQSGLPDSR